MLVGYMRVSSDSNRQTTDLGSVQYACKKLHLPTHARVVNNGLMSSGIGGVFISMRY